MTRRIAIPALALALAACSGGERTVAEADPSKLSEELEARAREIEQRADAAVAQAEQQANQHLAALNEEARQAAVQAPSPTQRENPEAAGATQPATK